MKTEGRDSFFVACLPRRTCSRLKTEDEDSTEHTAFAGAPHCTYLHFHQPMPTRMHGVQISNLASMPYIHSHYGYHWSPTDPTGITRRRGSKPLHVVVEPLAGSLSHRRCHWWPEKMVYSCCFVFFFFLVIVHFHSQNLTWLTVLEATTRCCLCDSRQFRGRC
ncbi:hypothetical protein PISMIDRAFT_458100 [Pisolithus microcarpus 441]|uniref:Uncharacterized protein n=1 Tax=Pisolithus microcarpus 441 TaxID=765257 RepID=A0A0C9YWH5_9AGAM|nr:hypothetical protein PISMIDRAFT_458100 [Pisolithus microcarpus 441]